MNIEGSRRRATGLELLWAASAVAERHFDQSIKLQNGNENIHVFRLDSEGNLVSSEGKESFHKDSPVPVKFTALRIGKPITALLARNIYLVAANIKASRTQIQVKLNGPLTHELKWVTRDGKLVQCEVHGRKIEPGEHFLRLGDPVEIIFEF